MIHVALEVMAFLFLCWVGLMLLAIVFRILGTIGDALGKLFAPRHDRHGHDHRKRRLRWAMTQSSQTTTQERARYA